MINESMDDLYATVNIDFAKIISSTLFSDED